MSTLWVIGLTSEDLMPPVMTCSSFLRLKIKNLFEGSLVAVDHRLYTDSLLHVLPAIVSIYLRQPPTILDRLSHLVPLPSSNHDPHLPVLDYLRCRSHRSGHDWRTARQSFGHHQPKRFLPLDGEQQQACPPKQLPLALSTHLTLVDDRLPIYVRLDALLEVMGVHSRVYLASHAQRDACFLGYVDGVVGSFVLAESSEK